MTLTTQDILTTLQETEPVSIIRCGDGEGIVLNGYDNTNDYMAVLKRQLGYYPPIDHGMEIHNNLIEAYSKADIIGIPKHKNLESLSAHWRSVVDTLDKFVPARTGNVCSMDIHYDFLQAGYFDTLLQGQEVVNYIGCRQLEQKMMEKWGINQVNGFHISPERKFTTTYVGEDHYPTQFNKVQRWMDVVGAEGRILLVGAGFVGKIYCNWWRDRGGKAFDIGSIMDEWAGAVTRGPEREADRIIEDGKGWKL